MERYEDKVIITKDEISEINADFTNNHVKNIKDESALTILLTSTLAHDIIITSILELNNLDENSDKDTIVTMKKEDNCRLLELMYENSKKRMKSLKEKDPVKSAIPILVTQGLVLLMYHNLIDKLFNENEQPKEEQQ